MSEIKGKLTTCDRCGKTVFLKTIGDGEADGGFTRWNKFEPYPDGWDLVAVPDPDHTKHLYIRVCPDCHQMWRKIINDGFLKDTLFFKNSQDDMENENEAP